jgi:hypothetical protein
MGGRVNEVKCCPCPDCNGNTIYECTHKEEWEIALRRAKIGESWEMDSSLEKWFPLSAEELEKLRKQVRTLQEIIKDHTRQWSESKTRSETDKYVIRRLVEAIDQYLSESGYNAAATILTNARADAVNLK